MAMNRRSAGPPAGRSPAGPSLQQMVPQEYNMQFGQQQGASAGTHVDAYLEYKRIVGDDDGGVPFTPEQYDEYKRTVVVARMKNRVFVSWAGPSGIECKMVGPETPCFCGHRYKGHKTDFLELPKGRPIKLPCRERGCKCSSFHFIPMNGSQSLRCSCKHTTDEHKEVAPYLCSKSNCKCSGYKSGYTCGCGAPVHQHEMIVESKDEREARGKPVGWDGVPYQAMGGITGFSSLAEGYQRLDPSGIGALSEDMANAAITANDHPFLRANAQAVHHHALRTGAHVPGVRDHEADERDNQARREGESEMDYYERRYKEKQKASKVTVGLRRK